MSALTRNRVTTMPFTRPTVVPMAMPTTSATPSGRWNLDIAAAIAICDRLAIAPTERSKFRHTSGASEPSASTPSTDWLPSTDDRLACEVNRSDVFELNAKNANITTKMITSTNGSSTGPSRRREGTVTAVMLPPLARRKAR